jgi:hypothetical protein
MHAKALVLFALAALAGDVAGLEQGIRQYHEGLLSEAVITLDSAITALAGADQPDALARAYVYKGAALVGLLQEQAAKDAFTAALQANPSLRLAKGEFPDRIVRVFEAARKGKTSSVMQRPNTAPKKAGIGAFGIAAIAAGAAAVIGGVAVAAGGGGDAPAATPTTTMPPPPPFTVTPVGGTAFGPIQIEFVGSTPSSGTLSGCGASGAGCPITVTFRLLSSGAFRNLDLSVDALSNQGALCHGYHNPSTTSGHFDLNAQEPFLIGLSLTASGRCSAPTTLTVLNANTTTETGRSGQQWRVQWVLNP